MYQLLMWSSFLGENDSCVANILFVYSAFYIKSKPGYQILRNGILYCVYFIVLKLRNILVEMSLLYHALLRLEIQVISISKKSLTFLHGVSQTDLPQYMD